MKLKMLKKIPAAVDGVKVRELVPDEIIEVNEADPRAKELADLLMREGFAEEVSEKEAAEHLKELEELSPEEKIERAAVHEDKAAAEAEFARVAKKEKKDTRNATRLERKRRAVGIVEEPKPTPPAPPPPEPMTLALGSVVKVKGAPGPIMTLEKWLDDSHVGAVCVWFDEKDRSAPKRAEFLAEELEIVPTQEA